MKRFRHGWLALGMTTVGLLALGSGTARAAFLTGAIVYSSDSTGAPSSGQFWNTVGGDNRYNLYFAPAGDPATVSLMNSGDGASTGLNINVGPGVYSYQLFGGNAQGLQTYSIGLFLNGDTSAPSLSAVFSGSNIAPIPVATPAPSLDGTAATSTGSLSVVDGSTMVTLTGFTWSVPTAGGPDRVSGFNDVPSGAPDFVGSLTLTVSAVPEPTSLALLALGTLGAAIARRRMRRAAIA